MRNCTDSNLTQDRIWSHPLYHSDPGQQQYPLLQQLRQQNYPLFHHATYLILMFDIFNI